MKKGLLVVLVLAMVFTFAFADETGLVSLGTDKGVVTVGEPVTVSYSLEVQDMSDQITTIEVMGDEIADNVFVMLIKDAPNNAQYEATKAVDADAKKTTYYIKAVELVGKKGVLKASLMNWKNEVVASKEVPFEWKDDMFTDSVELVPEAEGIYTVKASIEFEDGTVMSLEDWQGYAQLVALKKYVEESIPGLTANLVWNKSAWNDHSVTVKEYGAANRLKVSAGVEYMQTLPEQGDPKTYLGIYGDGSEVNPEIEWTYNKTSKPEFADVELAYKKGKTAYIKFKVMSEALEGDCCGTEGGDKWALWLAMGTGQVHTMYETQEFDQSLSYHLIGASMYKSWYWDIVKGDICKGWVKAIFFLDPTDVKIWVTAVLGTYWYEDGNVPGMDGKTTGNIPDGAPTDNYYQNLLDAAELNIFTEVEFKEAVTIKFAALNIPLNSRYSGNATASYNMNPVYVGSIEVDLESDAGHTVSLGALVRYDSSLAATETEWAMDAYLGSFDLNMNGGFPIEALSTVKFGAYLAGNLNNDNQLGLNIEHLQLLACFGADLTCCIPEFKIGAHFAQNSEGNMAFSEVFGSYSHAIGTYGPVSLEGELGFVYAFADGAVDNGSYGTGSHFTGPAFGVAYQVTGTMIW